MNSFCYNEGRNSLNYGMAMNIKSAVTTADYLAAERAAQTRSEWVHGEVREMVGASRQHGMLTTTLSAMLFTQLGDEFEVYSESMRVGIPNGPYYYPEVVVCPSSPHLEDGEQDTLLNPCVIFEVLSPTTETIDRREKLDNYRRIPSLADYVLVAQDECRMERFDLRSDQKSQPSAEVLNQEENTLVLESLGVSLSLADVYRRIL